MKIFAMFLLFCSFALSCQKEEKAGLRCGPGTHEENGVCIANVQLPEVTAPPTPKVQPTKESLLEKFESDLFSYGVDRSGNEVNFQPISSAREGFKKISEGVYESSKSYSGWGDSWVNLFTTDIQIEESDLEKYSYEGMVTFRTELHGTGYVKSSRGKGVVRYVFGAKTNRWKRAELKGE